MAFGNILINHNNNYKLYIYIYINNQLKNAQSLKLFVQLFLRTFPRKHGDGNIENKSSNNCKVPNNGIWNNFD